MTMQRPQGSCHIGVVTTGHGPRDEYLHCHRMFLGSLGADVRVSVRHIYEDLSLEDLLPHEVDRTTPNLGAHVHVPGAKGNHMGDGWEHRIFALEFATRLVQKTIELVVSPIEGRWLDAAKRLGEAKVEFAFLFGYGVGLSPFDASAAIPALEAAIGAPLILPHRATMLHLRNLVGPAMADLDFLPADWNRT